MNVLESQIIVPNWGASYRDLYASLTDYEVLNEVSTNVLYINNSVDYYSVPPVKTKNQNSFAQVVSGNPVPDNEYGTRGFTSRAGDLVYQVYTTTGAVKITNPKPEDAYLDNSADFGQTDKDPRSFSMSAQVLNFDNDNYLTLGKAYNNQFPYLNDDRNDYRATHYVKNNLQQIAYGDWTSFSIQTPDRNPRKVALIRIRSGPYSSTWLSTSPAQMLLLGRKERTIQWNYIHAINIGNKMKFANYQGFEFNIPTNLNSDYDEYRIVFEKNCGGSTINISELSLGIDRSILTSAFNAYINNNQMIRATANQTTLGDSKIPTPTMGLTVYGTIYSQLTKVQVGFNPLGIASIQSITGSTDTNTGNMGLTSVQSETGDPLMTLSQNTMFLPSSGSTKQTIPTEIKLGTVIEGKLYQTNQILTPYVLPVKTCQYISTSGSYALPLRYKKITVEMLGAGGGGGSGFIQAVPTTGGNNLSGACGGASGSYGKFTLYYHQVQSSNIDIVIGAGGIAGSNTNTYSGNTTVLLNYSGTAGTAGTDTSVAFTAGNYMAYWLVKGGNGGNSGAIGGVSASTGGSSASAVGVFDTILSGQNNIANTTTTPSQVSNTSLVYQVGAGGNGSGNTTVNTNNLFISGANSGSIVKPSINHTLKSGYTTYASAGNSLSNPNGSNALTIQQTLHSTSGGAGGISHTRDYTKNTNVAGNGGSGLYGSGGGGGGSVRVFNASFFTNDTIRAGYGGNGGNGLVKISIQ